MHTCKIQFVRNVSFKLYINLIFFFCTRTVPNKPRLNPNHIKKNNLFGIFIRELSLMIRIENV